MRNILLALILVGIVSCSSNEKSNQPTVTVSILPQKFFIDQIAGDWLKVNVMVPSGSSPATYEPTPLQMRNLANSSTYFRIGHIGFEKSWMEKLISVNPAMKVVDTSKDLDLIVEQEWDADHGHEHHHHHGHSHEGFNPHIWLSPNMVKQQVTVMYTSLIDQYPEYKDTMTVNLHNFLNRCDSLSKVLDQSLTNAKGTSFIVYHPVWNYLARDYGLNQISIEHNGKEATVDKLKEIIDYAKNNNIKIIIAQKEFSDAQAKTIANEIDGEVLLLNPLDYYWFKVMQEFAAVFN